MVFYNLDLNPSDCVIAAGPLEVVFEFYDKTDIFIHHFGQFLSPNSRSRVDVDKGKFVKIAVSSLTNCILNANRFNHGLRTPNEDINQRNLEIWADVADKICFGRT